MPLSKTIMVWGSAYAKSEYCASVTKDENIKQVAAAIL
jgi:hypothetical protein